MADIATGFLFSTVRIDPIWASVRAILTIVAVSVSGLVVIIDLLVSWLQRQSTQS